MHAATMTALVRRTYGAPEAISIEQVPVPAVEAEQVLVRVAAASVNPLDWHELTGTPWIARLQGGLRRPKQPVLGVDVAGTVHAVGSAVTHVSPGDMVFGAAAGSFAEYARAKGRSLVPIPPGVSALDASTVAIAGTTALQALRDKGRVQAGHKVLVIGASGGVGTYAVQLAAAMGATVTGVCSTPNVQLVRSLGAHHVIDYTTGEGLTGGPYDVIIDSVGSHSLRARRAALAPGGRCVIVGGPKKGRVLGPLGPMVRAVASSLFSKRKFVPFMAAIKTADLEVLAGHLASGTVKPVVERTYQLSEGAEALRHVAGGHTRGKVVLAISG